MDSSSLTSRSPETSRKRRHRSRTGKIGWFMTDQELIDELGVPEDTARIAIKALDEDKSSGFPKKQSLWGDRRSAFALEQWFKEAYGLKMVPTGLRRAS